MAMSKWLVYTDLPLTDNNGDFTAAFGIMEADSATEACELYATKVDREGKFWVSKLSGDPITVTIRRKTVFEGSMASAVIGDGGSS